MDLDEGIGNLIVQKFQEMIKVLKYPYIQTLIYAQILSALLPLKRLYEEKSSHRNRIFMISRKCQKVQLIVIFSIFKLIFS